MSTPILNDRTVLLEHDDTVYTIGQPIPEDAPVIAQWRRTISASLEIDSLVIDMERTAKMLNVGHLASADYPLIQNSIWQVMANYQSAVGDAELAFGAFSHESKTVLNNLLGAFEALADGRFHRSVTLIKRCAKSAKSLAANAEKIADQFKALIADAQTTVGDAQKQTALDQDEIAKLQKDVDALKADFVEQSTLAKNYADQKEKVQKLYEETLADARTAEQHAFIAEMVGSVASALGAGLSAYAAASTPRIMVGDGSSVVPTDPSLQSLPAPAKPSVADIAPDDRADEGEMTAGEDDGMEDVPDEDASETSEAPKKTVAEKAAQNDEKTAKAVEESDKDTHAKIAGIAATADKVAERADNVADKAQSAAVALRQEVAQLLDLQFEIDDKRIQSLAKVARYTVLLKSDVKHMSTLQISVASLAQAIGAMQSARAAFSKMADFWKAMEQACDTLGGSNDFVEDMLSLDRDGVTAADVDFIDNTFKTTAIDYCAGWTALHQISTEANQRTAGLGKNLAKFVAQHPEESVARAEATRMAADLGLDVGKATKALEAQRDRAKELSDFLKGDADADEQEAA